MCVRRRLNWFLHISKLRGGGVLPSFMTIVFDVLGFIVVHLRCRGLRGGLREVSQDGSGSVPEKV